MKLHHFLKSTVAALACAGTLIPGGLVQAGETAVKTQAKKPANIVRDLSLTKDGVLEGQVSDAKKAASSGVVVSIRQVKERKEVHRTKTDDKGRFEVRDLKPGTYYIVAGT
ncbi:MAG: putative surface anchored protein, partial [Planctomycetaceae bacterium]